MNKSVDKKRSGTTIENLGLQVADHISAMLAYWDNQQICRFANHAYVDWFGKSREDMVNKITMKELLGPVYEKNLPFIHAVLEGEPQVFEREILTPSGEKRHSIANYYPDIVDGKIKGFFVHVADITRIKMLEMELKASELKFRSLLESAPDCLVIVNKEGIIELINTQCEKVFGYTKNELLGQSVKKLLPERFQKTHTTHVTNYFYRPSTRAMGKTLELFGLRKNGEEFPVEISLSPLETKEGVLVSAAIRDSTWKVKKEKELLRSYEIINNQNKKLLNFSYTVSHNLRSHSGNMAMLLNFFKEAETEAEKSQLFAYLQETSLRFTQTVNHLNEIVEAQSKQHVEQVRINLRQYIERCLELLQASLQQTQAQVYNLVTDQIELSYNAAYMESILLNFLTNAIKYRHPERPPVVVIDVREKENELLLIIKDNGRGINLTKHGDALFGMYKTFHENPDAKGLGLFITKYQVEALGGHIQVESEEGVGTTFHICFLK
jgi:PAS domain S-box-containing protein